MTETQVRERSRLSASERFYRNAIQAMSASGVAFMLGGAYALREYGGIFRETKDLDVFCRPGEYPQLLQSLAEIGCRTEITDATWLAKGIKDDLYVDLIFASKNGSCPVDNTWFDRAPKHEFLGETVRLIPPEEMIWSKSMVQERFRFDGADVLHVIRKSGRDLDWHHLLMRMDPLWEILLAQLLTFRFVYPSERDVVPQWLMDELLERVRRQQELPTPVDRVCRGRILSRAEYEVDLKEWDYRET